MLTVAPTAAALGFCGPADDLQESAVADAAEPLIRVLSSSGGSGVEMIRNSAANLATRNASTGY